MRRQNSLLAFPWYGGKYSHLPFILRLIHRAGPHAKFVDVYGGSASVVLNKRPSPIDCYNDLDGEVVNFFRVLRDHASVLCRKLALTPYSREEYTSALSPDRRCVDDIERARRFFIVARMTRNAMALNGASFRWSYAKMLSRRGMSKNVSAWFGGIAELEDVAARLARIEVERVTATECVRLHDSPETVFYVDPPYVHDTRASCDDYGANEMDVLAHEELAEALRNASGRVLLSGYNSPLYRRLYKGWRVHKGQLQVVSSSRCSTEGGQMRREIVWANFNLKRGRETT